MNGLGVMRDHALHEPNVGLGIEGAPGDDHRGVIVLLLGSSGRNHEREKEERSARSGDTRHMQHYYSEVPDANVTIEAAQP
jgi:hypothetical protein